MTDIENQSKTETPPAPPVSAPPTGKAMEGQAQVGEPGKTGGLSVTAIVNRFKREDIVKRGSLLMRSIGFVFSLLSFIIMASNNHGGWQNYDNYDEYKYVLAIAIISTIYTGAQAGREIHALSTGKQLFPPWNLAIVDFIGDQIMAYLLISAASSASPLTNNFRKGADNLFTDSSATSIAFEFLAFFALALSSILSGYKLSTQSYI